MENEYRSTKMGDIQKCPNCGAVVESLTGKCKECGYEFRNVEIVNSAQKFSEMLQKIEQDKAYQDNGIFSNADYNKRNRIVLAIQSFPVPTGKEDLYNFLTMLQGLQQDIRYGGAYQAKYKECLIRVKSLFPNDELFKSVLEQEKKLEQQKEQEKRAAKRRLILLNILSVTLIVVGGVIHVVGYDKDMENAFLFCGFILIFFGNFFLTLGAWGEERR